MSRVFGVRAVVAGPECRIELPPTFDTEIDKAASPQAILSQRLVSAVNSLISKRHAFDILIVYLPEKWQRGFWGDDDDFDLHHLLKASTAVSDIPCQIVRDHKSGALSYFCRCSVAWRLSIALYAKAGGIPWILANVPTETVFIGLGYAIRADTTSGGRFVSCCSQVFDANGSGLEFLVYGTNEAYYDGDNPFLTRTDFFKLMSRSLEMYQRRNPGSPPKRIVVHKDTEFKREEIDGAFDAFPRATSVDLIQVQQDSPWRGLNFEVKNGNGEVANYPCHRGSYAALSGRDVLMWTQGDATTAESGSHFFKEGKGIPSPLLLRRHAGHGGWEETCRWVLGLTKLDWNSDSLYTRLPATIEHAQTLAQVVKRAGNIGSRTFQYRFFM